MEKENILYLLIISNRKILMYVKTIKKCLATFLYACGTNMNVKVHKSVQRKVFLPFSKQIFIKKKRR